MRTALVNLATSAVDLVIIAGPGYEAPEGYRAVPSDTANKGDSHDGAAFMATVYAPSRDHLAAHARDAARLWRETARAFTIVSPFGTAPVTVLCDGSDATLGDLASLWRRGLVAPTETFIWHDHTWTATPLTGAQCVALDQQVGAWRSAIVAALAKVLADIDAGALATLAAIDALAWPAGA